MLFLAYFCSAKELEDIKSLYAELQKMLDVKKQDWQRQEALIMQKNKQSYQ